MGSIHEAGRPASPRSSKDTLRDSDFDSKDSDDDMSDELDQRESRRLLGDVEARPGALTLSQEKPHRSRPSGPALEYRVPTGTKLTYLGLYFLLNLSLTIYNKAILGAVRTHGALLARTCSDPHHPSFTSHGF
jgi:hypothetical protein